MLKGGGSRGKTQRSWGMPWIRRAEVRGKAEWLEKDLTTKSAVGEPNRRGVIAGSNPCTCRNVLDTQPNDLLLLNQDTNPIALQIKIEAITNTARAIT